MAPPLITYLGDPQLKTRFIREIRKYERADQIVKGSYGSVIGTWYGCAIGCSLRSLNLIHGAADPNTNTDMHARYPTELGLPLWLAYLEDHIFESLPKELSRTWPRRFAQATPVGATVDDLVLAKILRWVLGDATFGARNVTKDPTVVGAVDRVVALFDRAISGDNPTPPEWRDVAKAEEAAWTAGAAGTAWAAGIAKAAKAAGTAWAEEAAGAEEAAWAAGTAGAAWAARAAWAAGIAKAAGTAWAAGIAKKADQFYPALAKYILSLLRGLSTP